MNIDEAAAALRDGQLVAFPTETVYGLGADATNPQAVARVYAAKGRPQFNPLITHCANIEDAFALGQFSDEAKQLAGKFWPGPLTIVVERAENCPVAKLASAGLSSIALRVPDHALAQSLIAKAGVPVVAPSANPSGKLSPTKYQHVRDGLPDVPVLDGGACRVGVESSVVSFLDGQARLLRPGGLSRADLGIPLANNIGGPLHAPGGLESHYAPNAKMRLNISEVQPGEGLLAFGPQPLSHDGPMRNLSSTGDVVEAAARLFDDLHALDDLGVSCIAVMAIPNEGLGEAVNDRLARAAYPR